eukprot:TRINITY_DN26044_c0_g1_i1.p1 TRINITY_DN26044_c0_g1~~TRINITY_DN26044_c0_g1_i1.p1  ORF type:complete len:268 (+),score=-26.82 TRINITY_DN26044_c0_g1_i1:252-1055(+)
MAKRDNNVEVYLKNAEDIKLMEISCRIVADTLSHLKSYVKPGVETIELDKIAEDFILSKGGRPAFKGYRVGRETFPYTLCISVDEVVVHGMPGSRKLKEGEIVSIDVGAEKNGFYGDSAVTYPVGKISEAKERLLKVTEESLFKGIAQAVENNKIYDVSRAIQEHCEKAGYSLTRELVGHGIGKRLHEEPPVPNFVPALLHRNRFPNVKLQTGLAIAIEPMVHMGKKEVATLKDGWTVVTQDGTPAAHFEHTIVVNKNEPIILTLRD